MKKHREWQFAATGALIVFVVALVLAPVVIAQVPARAICGRWKVKRVIPTTNIQTSPDDAKKYLGTEIVYAADEFKFGSEAAEHIKYKTGRMTAANFYEEYRAQLKELGVTRDWVSTIEVLDAKGDAVLNPGATVFVRNANIIVTMWDGIYFEVVRETPETGTKIGQ